MDRSNGPGRPSPGTAARPDHVAGTLPLIVRLVRRIMSGTWVVAALGLVGLAASSHLVTSFIIRGPSMEPAIPVGALAWIAPVAPDSIRPGEVISVRADNGVVVTHRVIRIAEGEDGLLFQLKGDANPRPDPVLVPERALLGRVVLAVPTLGFLAAMLGTPLGLLSLLSLMVAWHLAIRLVEEAEDDLLDRPRPGAALHGVGPRSGVAA